MRIRPNDRITCMLFSMALALAACNSGSAANSGNNNNNNVTPESCDNGTDDDGDGDVDCADADCVADPDCVGDPCAGINCSDHGMCDDSSGSAVCICDAGYQDRDADGSCEVDCSGNDCSGHGTCDDSSGVAVCICETGYTDDACDACDTGYQDNDTNGTCAVDCSGIACPGGGLCDDSTGEVSCPRDGTYTGTLHVDVEDIGFVTNNDSCDSSLTVVVSTVSSPQITASTVCHMTGILTGQSLDIDLEGNITNDPLVAGDVYLDWSPMFQPQDTWSGSFVGLNTIQGAFDGSVMQGSAGFGWTATFTADR